MKLSIVIPTNNRPSNLKAALESIKGFNFDYEVIVVENNSTKSNKDKYKKLIKNYNAKFISYDEKGISVGDARNKGMEMAKGRYVFFLDDDDVLNHEFVEYLNNTKLVNNVLRFKYITKSKGKVMGINHKGKIPFYKIFDSVQISTYLINCNFLRKNKIYWEKDILHQDNHFASLLWKHERNQFCTNIISITYTDDNSSIQRSKKKWPTELKTLERFEDKAYGKNDIFHLKLFINIIEMNRSKMFDRDVSKKLYEYFELNIKPWARKVKIPAYYRFAVTWYLLKRT